MEDEYDLRISHLSCSQTLVHSYYSLVKAPIDVIHENLNHVQLKSHTLTQSHTHTPILSHLLTLLGLHYHLELILQSSPVYCCEARRHESWNPYYQGNKIRVLFRNVL